MHFIMFVVAKDMLDIPAGAQVDVEPWVDKYNGSGQRVLGDRTAAADDSRTVRVRDGELQVARGFADPAGDYIAGFDVLDCESIEEAVEVAAAHPMAHYGAIEIRPFWVD